MLHGRNNRRRKWSTLGCTMRLANHSYLQQAIQRGFLLTIQSHDVASSRTEIGRDERASATTHAVPNIRPGSIRLALTHNSLQRIVSRASIRAS